MVELSESCWEGRLDARNERKGYVHFEWILAFFIFVPLSCPYCPSPVTRLASYLMITQCSRWAFPASIQ